MATRTAGHLQHGTDIKHVGTQDSALQKDLDGWNCKAKFKARAEIKTKDSQDVKVHIHIYPPIFICAKATVVFHISPTSTFQC